MVVNITTTTSTKLLVNKPVRKNTCINYISPLMICYNVFLVFKQQQQTHLQPQIPGTESTNWATPPPTLTRQHTIELDHINQQQDSLRQQIKQSEQNLSAQQNVLLQQQQVTVEAAVAKCESVDMQQTAEQCGIVLSELNAILQPIIDSCTKDSISNGKSWFLQHATTKQKSSCIVQCLLYK